MIDVHTHVVPPLDYRVGPDPRWPVVEVDAEGATVTVAGRPFRRVRPAAVDLGRRLAELQDGPVRAQVLSPMPELFSYWAPPAEAAEMCRRVNDWIAAAAEAHPGSFHGLGIVPMQDPELAADEVGRVAASGLRGVMVGSNIEGRLLSDERFMPFFQAAADTGMAVFVHAFHPPQAAQLPAGPAGSAVTFPQEIAVAMGALIAAGVLARVPRLRLGASHGGGGLVFTIGRMSHAWAQGGALADVLPDDPMAYARRIFYDTLIFRADALRFLLQTVGAAQVVVGSDYPFSSVAPGWPLQELAGELGPAAVAVVEEQSASAFLGLDPAPAPSPPA